MADVARGPRRPEAIGARIAVTLTLVALGAGVLVARHLCMGQWKGRRQAGPESMQAQVNLGTVWVLGVLTWPLLFDAVVGLPSLRPIPVLGFSLIWPLVLLSFELHSLGHQTFGHQARASSNGGLCWECNSVSSLAFAVGGLIAARRIVQPRPTGALSGASAPLGADANAKAPVRAAAEADAGAVEMPAHLPAAVVSAVVILCGLTLNPAEARAAARAAEVRAAAATAAAATAAAATAAARAAAARAAAATAAPKAARARRST